MSILAIASDARTVALTWAKDEPAIKAAANGGVHYEVPSPPSGRKHPYFPLITVSLIDSGVIPGADMLIEQAHIQFSCWAGPFQDVRSAGVAAVVKTVCHYLRPTTVVMADGSRVTLHGAEVGQVLPLPGDADANACHTVDVTFTLTAKAAA